jgi:hypothetical protein
MPIARLRALSTDASLEIMRSVKTKEIVQKNGQVFFIRKEVAFGEQLRVMYVIRAQDSTLRRLIINVLEFAGLPGQTHGRYDTVWKRIERRFGSSVKADGSSRARRYWTTPTTTIEVFRFEGLASGVTLVARPMNEPP